MIVDASVGRGLACHVAAGSLVIAPVLLLPAVAGAIGRRTGRPRLARRAIEAVLRLPSLRLLDLDEVPARAAAAVGERLRLRGADAVCIAAAARLRLPLVTWGLEQRELATSIVDVFAPES